MPPKPRPLTIAKTRGSLLSQKRLRNQIAQSRNRRYEENPNFASRVRSLSSNTLTRKVHPFKGSPLKNLNGQSNDGSPTRLELLKQFKNYSRKNNLNVVANHRSLPTRIDLLKQFKNYSRKNKSKNVNAYTKYQKDRKESREKWKKMLPEIQDKKEKNDNTLQVKMMKNPYVISEKISTVYFRWLDGFGNTGLDVMSRNYNEYKKLMEDNPTDLIHFLVSYHIFLISISEPDSRDKKYRDIEIDDRYPSVKEMGDIYIGQGVNGVIQKLREIDIEFMKNNKEEWGKGIPKLRGAYSRFWKNFIECYKFKNKLEKVIYYGINDGEKISDRKYLKEEYVEEHPTDTRCELTFFLSERWRHI